MIAVDTNILVYAHREDAEWHAPAIETLRSLAAVPSTWSIPWPCLHEFFAIVTHPRIYSPPSKTSEAVQQFEAWLSSPSLVLLTEVDVHWSVLKANLTEGKVRGPMTHDARIAAICEGHGVTNFLTADRGFSRFSRLHAENPLIS
ncbi:MAG: VapC toxin family PIN domain ribonuclease [Gammaproteobacteria bacterium]|nr:VapC toxin family PIN domain ribonuclease [Gammaproteobacteria bacterium]